MGHQSVVHSLALGCCPIRHKRLEYLRQHLLEWLLGWGQLFLDVQLRILGVPDADLLASHFWNPTGTEIHQTIEVFEYSLGYPLQLLFPDKHFWFPLSHWHWGVWFTRGPRLGRHVHGTCDLLQLGWKLPYHDCQPRNYSERSNSSIFLANC